MQRGELFGDQLRGRDSESTRIAIGRGPLA